VASSYNSGTPPAQDARAVVGSGNVFSKFLSTTDLFFDFPGYVGAKLPWRPAATGLLSCSGVSLPLTADASGVEVKTNRSQIMNEWVSIYFPLFLELHTRTLEYD
jgi:hypothetical protein